MLELIRAVTIMPANAVLRLPVAQDGKVVRMRVEYEQEDRTWMREGTQLTARG